MPWADSIKNRLISVSLLQFTKKKIVRSSYEITMTDYHVVPIFIILRFVANAEDL